MVGPWAIPALWAFEKAACKMQDGCYLRLNPGFTELSTQKGGKMFTCNPYP